MVADIGLYDDGSYVLVDVVDVLNDLVGESFVGGVGDGDVRAALTSEC